MNQLFTSVAYLHPFVPILAIVLAVLVIMLVTSVKRSHVLNATLAVIGLNIGMFSLIAQMFGYWDVTATATFLEQSGHLFSIDKYAQFNMLVVFVCSLACVTLCYAYIDQYQDHKDELYMLILLSTIGALLMTASTHIASFFMSLELMSVPIYGMLAYTFSRNKSLESGLKYLVLSAAASATLLMGMALLFSQVGSLEFADIGQKLPQLFASGDISQAQLIVVVGFVLMLFATAFKLSAAPFHAWTPDVYEGAPAPIATFLGSVTKVAMMAVVVRFFLLSQGMGLEPIKTLLLVIATLSILFGNLLALRQTNLKRLLAYSSIAHIGYALVILISINAAAPMPMNMYMAVYALTTIGAFGVITLMSSPFHSVEDAGHLDHYQGLFWRRPILTAVLVMMMLSLAGIPLTAGFITKFYAVLASVQGKQWFLAAMIILGSAIGLYYYLRVILTLFKRPKDTIEFDAAWHWGIQAGGVMVMVVTFLVFYLGVLPSEFIELATNAKLLVPY